MVPGDDSVMGEVNSSSTQALSIIHHHEAAIRFQRQHLTAATPLSLPSKKSALPTCLLANKGPFAFLGNSRLIKKPE